MSGIARKTFVVGIFTALSRILGYLRDLCLAYYFGTSLVKSAFDVAFRIPNLLRRLFGEGALFSAFIPVFSETLNKNGHEEANSLLSRSFSLLAIVLSTITAIGIIFVSIWLKIGSESERVHISLSLLKIMLPYGIFICCAALLMAALNSLGHFTVPALAPMLLNLIVILALILISPFFSKDPQTRITIVAWSVLVAGIIQFGILVPVLWKRGYRLKFDLCFSDYNVRKIIVLMGPTVIGMGVVQINVCVDGVLAMMAGTWAPAAMSYAERIIYLPLGIFATSLGTVLLPTFSKQATEAKNQDIYETFLKAIKRLMFIMFPSSVMLLILASPIINLAFKSGEFGEQSVVYSSRALACYAPGLIFFSLYKIVVPVFYARKEVWIPVKAGIYSVIFNFLMNIVAVFTLPDGYQHAGMALATVFASALNCILLCYRFHKSIGNPGWSNLVNSLVRIGLSSIFMGIIMWMVYRFISDSYPDHLTKLLLLFLVSISTFAGIAAYIVSVFFLCPTDFINLLSNFKQQITKKT